MTPPSGVARRLDLEQTRSEALGQRLATRARLRGHRTPRTLQLLLEPSTIETLVRTHCDPHPLAPLASPRHDSATPRVKVFHTSVKKCT